MRLVGSLFCVARYDEAVLDLEDARHFTSASLCDLPVALVGHVLTYEPRRLHGVTVYRPSERVWAVGDRLQFTAPLRVRQIANRELGTIEAVEATGLRVRLDGGRRVTI